MRNGVVLAVDFGDKKTGLAFASEEEKIPLVLPSIEAGSKGGTIREIKDIVIEKGITKVIVGVPLAPDGGLGKRGKLTMEFAKELADVLGKGIDVVAIDERFTTKEAHEVLKQAGVKASTRKRKGVDSVSAVLILNRWLNGEPEIPLDHFDTL